MSHEGVGMVATALLAASLVPSPAADSHQTAVLTNTNLSAVAAATATYKPKDQFDAPPAPPGFAGRRFKISGPLEDINQGDHGAPGTWSYDRGAGKLAADVTVRKVSLNELAGDPMAFVRFGNISGFQFELVHRPAGRYRGQNAFGASAVVSRYDDRRVMVVEFTEGFGPTSLPISTSRFGGYSTTIDANPEEARRLTRDLRVVIEGTISPLAAGQVVHCGGSFSPATLAEPAENSITTCVFPSKIERVAIEDTGSARIVAEWVRTR